MKRVNVIFEDSVWKALEEVPKGERSSLVNAAVAHYFAAARREKAHQDLALARKKLAGLKTDVVGFLRRDRSEGH